MIQELVEQRYCNTIFSVVRWLAIFQLKQSGGRQVQFWRTTSTVLGKAVTVLVLVSLLATLSALPAQGATKETTSSKDTVSIGMCSGDKADKKLVKKLDRDLAKVIKKHKRVNIRIAFRDQITGTECFHRQNSKTYARSIIKVTLVAALLYKNKRLTARQKGWANSTIRYSANDPATKIWKALGKRRGMQRFLTAAGMKQTVPHPGRFWGNTLVTAKDQLILMELLTDTNNQVLPRGQKKYIVNLMKRVTPSQRWGISAGILTSATKAIKNGWGPSDYAPGWWINSIGSVQNAGHRYRIAIITNRQRGFGSGVSVINQVGRTINRAFARYPVREESKTRSEKPLRNQSSQILTLN